MLREPGTVALRADLLGDVRLGLLPISRHLQVVAAFLNLPDSAHKGEPLLAVAVLLLVPDLELLVAAPMEQQLLLPDRQLRNGLGHVDAMRDAEGFQQRIVMIGEKFVPRKEWLVRERPVEIDDPGRGGPVDHAEPLAGRAIVGRIVLGQDVSFDVRIGLQEQGKKQFVEPEIGEDARPGVDVGVLLLQPDGREQVRIIPDLGAKAGRDAGNGVEFVLAKRVERMKRERGLARPAPADNGGYLSVRNGNVNRLEVVGFYAVEGEHGAAILDICWHNKYFFDGIRPSFI